MAFRKRVKIAKGIHLNLSGSGIGFGYKLFPGLSFSINKNGVYCNTSIPGTGFYSRNKVLGNSHSKSLPIQSEQTSIEPLTSQYQPSRSCIEAEVRVHAENDGSFSYKIFDLDGNENKDIHVESEIIRSRQFKELVVRTINDCTSELVDMYKLTARPLTISDMERKVEEAKPLSPDQIERKLKKVKPKEITPSIYDVEKPSLEAIREELNVEAQKKVSSLFFWTNNRKRETYVEEKLHSTYKERVAKWENDKREYDAQQAAFVKKRHNKVFFGFET